MDVFNNFHPSQQTLNLVFNVKDPVKQNSASLREVLKYLTPDGFNQIGTVHFAHFIFMEDDVKLLVFTTYDGEFNEYINDVIDKTADALNALFTYVQAPENIIPVQQNRRAFIDFITSINVKDQVFYSAYPNLKVADIIKEEPEYQPGEMPLPMIP